MNEMIRTKIQTFFDKERPVHVDTKSGKWYNGFIREISADFFIINEFKFGEVPVFFLEVTDVTPFVPRGAA
jgi:hypothetical protein